MTVLAISIIIAAVILSLAYLGAKFVKEAGDVSFWIIGGIVLIGMYGLDAVKSINKQNCPQVKEVKHVKQAKDKNESK